MLGIAIIGLIINTADQMNKSNFMDKNRNLKENNNEIDKNDEELDDFDDEDDNITRFQ